MLKIYINTWGNYNENGADGGEWITLPMDEDELDEILETAAERMNDYDPEWFVNDYEWTIDVDECIEECADYYELNELAQRLDDLDDYEQDVFCAIMEANGGTIADALDIIESGDFQFYQGMELSDVAYELVEECYFTKDTPDIFTRYFDYDAFARDLSFDGYNETSTGVIYLY